MPLSAMVTPLSLYMIDQTIFDGIILPTSPENPTNYPDLYVQGFNLDRDVLINNLLMETGEMSVMYPDPEFFKYAVTNWSKKQLPVWQELYNTLFYKYNPLWNKDGTIKETARDLTARNSSGTRTAVGEKLETTSDTIRAEDSRDLYDQHSGTISEERTPDITRTVAESSSDTGTVTDSGSSDKTSTHSEDSTVSGTDSTENKVAGYNDGTGTNADYKNRSRNDTDRGENTNTNSTDTENGSSGNIRTNNLAGTREVTESESGLEGTTTTDSRKIEYKGGSSHGEDNTRESSGSDTQTETTSGSDSGSLDHSLTRTEQGNIGVTMTTALIEEQRKIVQFNFYDKIIEEFKARFCILVY